MWMLPFIVLLVPALILCGLVIFRLFAMCIVDRLISPLELTIILFVIGALMAQAYMMEGLAAIGPIILLALVIGLVPALPHVMNAVHGRRLLRDDIRRYHAALERQPDVPYPHYRLGEIYQQRGDWDRAIEHYQAYLERHEMSADAKRNLERCLKRRRVERKGLRRCPTCGAYNGRDNVRCEECGLYLRGGAEIVDALTTPGMMRIWKWLIVVFLVPGLIVGMLDEFIPPVVAVSMAACSVVATLIFVYGKVLREEEI